MEIVSKGMVGDMMLVTVMLNTEPIKLERMEEHIDVNNLTDEEVRQYLLREELK